VLGTGCWVTERLSDWEKYVRRTPSEKDEKGMELRLRLRRLDDGVRPARVRRTWQSLGRDERY